MNKLSIFVLSISIFCSGYSLAKEEQTTNLSKKEIEKILVDKFVNIAAAYYINKNCHFLSKEETAEYVGQISNLNLYANRLIGDRVFAAQNKGKAISTHEKLKSCGEHAKTIFTANRMLTQMMYEDLILK